MYTRRGREKTQEEFAGADKGADGQKVPFLGRKADHVGVRGGVCPTGNFPKSGKQRGYETKRAEKIATSEVKFEREPEQKRELQYKGLSTPRCFCCKEFGNGRKQIG